MWIMTQEGFFSVVEHRDDPSLVLVRARCVEDITALCKRTGRSPAAAERNLAADYEWRITIAREEFEQIVVGMVADIDYDNFKNSVKSPNHKRAYMRVWEVLLSLQYPETNYLSHRDLGDEQEDSLWARFHDDYDDAA